MAAHSTRNRRTGGKDGVANWRPVEREDQLYACTNPWGPHNRCHHPTTPAAGYRPCAADPGCAIRIPAESAHRACFWHRADDHYTPSTPDGRIHELMAAG